MSNNTIKLERRIPTAVDISNAAYATAHRDNGPFDVDPDVSAFHCGANRGLNSAAYALRSPLAVEALADYAHAAWSGWMRYLFGHCTIQDDGSVTIPAAQAVRWLRQMSTDYLNLPDGEKESDRAEARKIIETLLGEGVTYLAEDVRDAQPAPAPASPEGGEA